MREGFETAVNNLSSALFNLTQEINEAVRSEESTEEQVPVSFAPAKSMKEAIELAREKAEYWTMGDDMSRILTVDALELSAVIYDGRMHFTDAEPDKYYLVSEDGSIGLTMDGCASIDWLYKMTFME